MTKAHGGPSVTVAGAGIFGLCVALAIQRHGRPVLLLDPHREHNASSVAAGLLSPFGEALFDPPAALHTPLLKAAMAEWPSFAAVTHVDTVIDGLMVGTDLADRASALGATMTELDGRVRIGGEGRVTDPSAALAALMRQFKALGGRFESRAFGAADLQVEGQVVLAMGPGKPLDAHLAPELAFLTPVKGQIAVLPNGPKMGPAVRWPGGYIVPQRSGARIGATMEFGVSNTDIEPAAIGLLIERARVELPDLDATGAHGQAGVRMETPDALPLVGPSRAPGVFLAAGARRNGWLLGPLVGEMIAAYVMGHDPGLWAAMLHPGRFD